MMVFTVLLTAVLIILSINTMRTYRYLLDSIERESVLEQSAVNLRSASDYLTQQVRLFVMTGDTEYAGNFFYESEVDQRRDRALEAIEPYVDTEEISAHLSNAMDASNNLLQDEIYAMRLTAEARGIDPASLSDRVAEVPLTAADAALTPEEQSTRAEELVFGSEYQAYKNIVYDETDAATELIIAEADRARSTVSVRYGVTLGCQMLFTMITLALVIGFLVTVMRQVIRPLRRNAALVQAKEPLPIEGSDEIRVFSAAYNEMFEQVAKDQVELSYEATHDALTGLYNRKVFDEIRMGEEKDFTLILADVDRFKEVNDTYGHDVGDQVLQKMAQVLLHNFRSEDYVCRIGGDEFAVVMVHADSSLRNLVETKMRSISEGMKDTSDGLPENTISAGVAFPDRENATEDVYIDADRALYRAKEEGRAGWRFY